MAAVEAKLAADLPPDWVPVEHRWHGLDRRQLVPAVIVLAIALFLTLGMPAIDDAVDWDDPTRAGDVMDLGSGITITPPIGWQIVNGTRLRTDDPKTGNQSVVLANGGAVITATTSTFDGDAEALLKQANKLNSPTHEKFKVRGEAKTITTSTGLTGVAQAYTSVPNEGLVVAFSFPAEASASPLTGGKPIGLVVTVIGDDDSMAGQTDAVGAAILSINRKAAS